jgi:hypothetical protein
MMADSLVQSLDRGMKIMGLLADRGPLSATAIAAELGIHQSSASRLLSVLFDSGFVRKPSYHRFALDYGALVFAGRAMHCFPAIPAAASACNRVTRETGLNATVGILWQDRLLYLTRTNADSSIVLIDNSAFTIHESSLGRYLAYERGREAAVELFFRSMESKESGGAGRPGAASSGGDGTGAAADRPGDGDAEATGNRRAVDDAGTGAAALRLQAERLYENTREIIDRHGFLYLENYGDNICNGSMAFQLDEHRAAMAIFSPTRKEAPGRIKELLEEAVDSIGRRGS